MHIEKKPKKDIMDFAGIWKDRPEMDKIFEKIQKGRKSMRMRDYKL